MPDDKWTDLEIKLAHQDKAIKDLSAALYDQQKRIDALEKVMRDVKDRVKTFSQPAPDEDLLDEKPPHY